MGMDKQGHMAEHFMVNKLIPLSNIDDLIKDKNPTKRERIIDFNRLVGGGDATEPTAGGYPEHNIW